MINAGSAPPASDADRSWPRAHTSLAPHLGIIRAAQLLALCIVEPGLELRLAGLQFHGEGHGLVAALNRFARVKVCNAQSSFPRRTCDAAWGQAEWPQQEGRRSVRSCGHLRSRVAGIERALHVDAETALVDWRPHTSCTCRIVPIRALRIGPGKGSRRAVLSFAL